MPGLPVLADQAFPNPCCRTNSGVIPETRTDWAIRPHMSTISSILNRGNARWFYGAALGICCAVMTGCGKKEQPPTPAAMPSEASPPPVANQAESPANTATPTAPTVSDPKAAIASADAAMKSRAYDQAALTLLALQQQRLSDQQAQAVRSRMVQLQGALAGAVANGDPKAKAAAEILRQSAMH
jgi:hypothetical protein